MLQTMQAVRQSMPAGAVGNLNAGTPAINRQATSQIRQAAIQQISRILNSNQKQAFNKMLGEPFDLSRIDPSLASSSSGSSSSDSPTPAKSRAASVRQKRAAMTKSAGSPAPEKAEQPNP